MWDVWWDVVGRCAAAACVRMLVLGACAGEVDKPVTRGILFSWDLYFVAETVEGGTP